MNENSSNKSQFLNVDLDIYSTRDLRPLVAAIESKVIVLHVGKHNRTWEAHLELNNFHLDPRKPDTGIRRFCKLIQKLPPEAQDIWNAAKIRRFDIGIDSAKGQDYWCALTPETLMAAAELRAQIAVTVYRYDMKSKRTSKAKKTP